MATVYQMEVNKRVDGEYQVIGEVPVTLFDLSDITGGRLPGADGVGKDGAPTYADRALNALQSALNSAVKSDARNKLKPQSTELKPGASIASTVEEFLAETERNGEGLKVYRAFIEAFKAYLPKSGRNQKTQEVLAGMVRSKEMVATSSQKRKDVLSETLAGFVDSLSAEDAAKFETAITGLMAAIEKEEINDEDLG